MSVEEKTSHQRPQGIEDRINLLEYLFILVKYKRLILAVPFVAGLLTCGLVFLMPNIYQAAARVIPPPEKTSDIAASLGAAGGLASLVSGGGSPSAELYVAMLNSQTVADSIIDRFSLMDVYEQKYRTKTYEALAEHTKISADSSSGVITIAIEDEKPQRAADIANAFVEELQNLSLKMTVSSAGWERASLEGRVKVAEQDLAKAEASFKAFQQKHQMVRLEDQAQATIEAIARLQAEITAKEVELSSRLSYQTEDHPDVIALRETVKQLKTQVGRWAGGKGNDLSGDYTLTASGMSEVSLEYAALLRDYKIHDAVLTALIRQIELAKLEEAKNTAGVQILDHAMPPDHKSRPKRAIIVLAVMLFSGLLGCAWALFREYLAAMPDDDRRQWEVIMKHLGRAAKENSDS